METEYQRLARERTALHDNVGRYKIQVLEQRDYIGVIAEGEFAKKSGLNMNTDLIPAGDDGFDFRLVRTGETVDIKATERKDGRLMVPMEGKPLADYFVLAIVDTSTETARFAGWTTRDTLMYRGRREQYYDRWFYCMPQNQLLPFHTFGI